MNTHNSSFQDPTADKAFIAAARENFYDGVNPYLLKQICKDLWREIQAIDISCQRNELPNFVSLLEAYQRAVDNEILVTRIYIGHENQYKFSLKQQKKILEDLFSILINLDSDNPKIAKLKEISLEDPCRIGKIDNIYFSLHLSIDSLEFSDSIKLRIEQYVAASKRSDNFEDIFRNTWDSLWCLRCSIDHFENDYVFDYIES